MISNCTRSAQWRYENDPQFHQLVTMMEAMIHNGNYTVGEMREAATLACTNWALRHTRPWSGASPVTVAPLPDDVEEAMCKLTQWIQSGDCEQCNRRKQ